MLLPKPKGKRTLTYRYNLVSYKPQPNKPTTYSIEAYYCGYLIDQQFIDPTTKPKNKWFSRRGGRTGLIQCPDVAPFQVKIIPTGGGPDDKFTAKFALDDFQFTEA